MYNKDKLFVLTFITFTFWQAIQKQSLSSDIFAGGMDLSSSINKRFSFCPLHVLKGEDGSLGCLALCACDIFAKREIEGTLEWISISLAIPICKTTQCGPAEIPWNIFHILDIPPWRGICLVSGGYHHALTYPRLASLPSLEIIHREALPKLSASWQGTYKYQSYCCFSVAGVFVTPVGAVNCLFMSEVSVGNQTKPPDHEPLPTRAFRVTDSLSSCCWTPFIQSWANLTEYEKHCCTKCFLSSTSSSQNLIQYWKSVCSVALTSNYRPELTLGP